jgi:transcriptional regulator with XRE-family HTH domain
MLKSEAKLAAQLGAVVRRTREARGLSQATLAERIETSVNYVGMLERGERLASLGILLRVADALGVTMAELFAAPTPEPWAGEAVGLLRALPTSAREHAMAMLRGLAASLLGGSSSRRRRPS